MLRNRIEIICDWCSKKVILPPGITDSLTAESKKPRGWITMQWDVYGNCAHYCDHECKRRGRLEVEDA